jgi:hypothetical protein
MVKTFEHLLGLNAKNALALLAGYGITNVRVTLTGAPPLGENLTPACPSPERKKISALESIGEHFAVGEDEEEDSASFNPLTDPALDDGILVESRVVAVRDDGRQLIVARFHVGEPKPGLCGKPS